MAAYEEFLQTIAARQQQKSEQQLQTLRDLQIEDALADLPLKAQQRRLAQAQVGAELERQPMIEEAQAAEARVAARDASRRELDNLLNTSGDIEAVRQQAISEGRLNPTAKFTRVPLDPTDPKSQQVWALQDPSQPGYEQPQIINPDMRAKQLEIGEKRSTKRFAAKMDLFVKGYNVKEDGTMSYAKGGPADPTAKPESAPTNIQKLHMYRQSLIDDGAPQKLIDEVESQINKPETMAAVMGSILSKVGKGTALSKDELLALDVYGQYANPMAQMMAVMLEQMPESVRAKLLEKAGQTPGAGESIIHEDDDVIDLGG